MRVEAWIPCSAKRRRLINFDPMAADTDKANQADMVQKLGREVRVFETCTTSTPPDEQINIDEPDDFYEFTAADYYRMLANRKEDKFLKTRKIREEEETARRSRMTKAVIRVRFPDNYTLEAKFHASETLQSLVYLLKEVVAQPDIPFYIYTTPPKKQIKDLSQDFYSAGFVPGAIVYFSYDLPKGDDASTENLVPSLRDEIMSLCGQDPIPEQAEPVQSPPEPTVTVPSPVQENKPAEKKAVKPKWLKM